MAILFALSVAVAAPDLLAVDVRGRLHPAEGRLVATARLSVGPGPAPLVFDSVGLDVTSVTRDGSAVAYEVGPDTLTVQAAGGPLEVVYSVGASDGLVIEGDFASTQYSTWKWVPCVSDPAVRARFTVDLQVPEGSVLIASRGRPVPAYLWAFAVGPYASHARGQDAVVWSPAGQPVPDAFDDTAAVRAALAEWTGRPLSGPTVTIHPPYSVAQEFDGGALIGARQVERVPGSPTSTPWYVSHEALHEVFAVDVPLDSWGDHWINEAFASYGEALWDSRRLGHDAPIAAFLDRRWKRYEAGRADGRDRPLALDTSPRFGEGVGGWGAYTKGPLVLHRLRTTIGPRAFDAGVKLYARDGGSTAKLQAAMQTACACDLAALFRDEVRGTVRLRR